MYFSVCMLYFTIKEGKINMLGASASHHCRGKHSSTLVAYVIRIYYCLGDYRLAGTALMQAHSFVVTWGLGGAALLISAGLAHIFVA